MPYGCEITVNPRPSILRAVFVAIVLGGCSYVADPYLGRNYSPVLPGPEEAVDHRLLLLGDAGDPVITGEPSLQLLAIHVRRIPERTTVIYLGDNVYERGMPEEEIPPAADVAAQLADVLLPNVFDSRLAAERSVDAQIDVIRGSGARAFFIPGNHDWDQFEIGGWGRILALERYINKIAAGGVPVALRPEGGCPGPVPIPLGDRAMLIMLDTQWFLETREDGKPTPNRNPTNCRFTTEEEVRRALLAQMRAAGAEHRQVVIAGHHPLESNGPHGGFVDLDTHLFPFRMVGAFVPFYIEWIPLPVLGSAVAGLRACCSTSAQDLSNRRNHHMRAAILAPMIEASNAGFGPLLYAAGHDHSLQVFEGERGPRFTVVSGLGSSLKASAVGRSRRTLFAHSSPLHPGFVMVDFYRDGTVRLSVIERTGDAPEGEEVFSKLLREPAERSSREVASAG